MLWLRCLLLSFFSASLFAGGKLNVDAKGLALHGYDPVAYVKLGKAIKGKPRLDANLGKATFLFATDGHRQAFQKAPLKYLPAYGGWCAYAMAEGTYSDVDPASFKVLSGTTHLFYQGLLGDHLKKWAKDPARMKAAADAHWKKKSETKLP